MYLSRLILNPRSREVRRDLSNVQDMHRTVLSAFPQVDNSHNAREEHRVLYRHEPSLRNGPEVMLVQSRSTPDWTKLSKGYLIDSAGEVVSPSTKNIEFMTDALREGMTVGFRLRANATKKIMTKSGPNGERRNGKRVELRGDEQLFVWIARKAEQHGFLLPDHDGTGGRGSVRIKTEPKLKGRRGVAGGAPSSLTVATALFEGMIKITDLDRFKNALEDGIGSAKAYGCGLLSIRPINPGGD